MGIVSASQWQNASHRSARKSGTPFFDHIYYRARAVRVLLDMRCVTAFAAVACVPALAGLAWTEAATKPLKFEVASVKPADPNAKTSSSSRDAGEGLDIRNVPVRNLITLAYGLQDFQILNAPGWTNTEGYDVIAKALNDDIPSLPAGPQTPGRIA
jgi:hypothetical protein